MREDLVSAERQITQRAGIAVDPLGEHPLERVTTGEPDFPLLSVGDVGCFRGARWRGHGDLRCVGRQPRVTDEAQNFVCVLSDGWEE